MTSPQGTARNPLVVRTESGDLTPKAMLLRIGLTILVGYLAVWSQKAGADPDLTVAARMRLARAGQQLGDVMVTVGLRLSTAATKAYEAARP